MDFMQEKISRKDMLKMSLLGGAALMLPMERPARTQLAISNRIPESQLPQPFQVPLSIPPVLKPVKRTSRTDYYRLTMRQAQLQILPGFPKTTVYGYNGLTPGPTIKVMQGHPIVVRQVNRLPKNSFANYRTWTSVHLHGSASLPQYDGYASDITQPGQYKDYHYPNIQPARTLWYHDHGVHHTAENAYMGCAAQYHIHNKRELNLPIPHGRYDVPLVIQDKIFAQNGDFIFDDQGHSGLFGDVILVNGRPWPRMKVERRKYRFRILNASVSRSYRLALDSGEDMTVIGHDGGLAPHPAAVGDFRIGQAERYEVVIDFAKYKVGDKIILKNLGNPNNVPFASVENVMRFDVSSEATSRKNNSVPDVLDNARYWPYSPMGLQESQATSSAKIEVIRKNGLWTINGETWQDVIESKYLRTVANPKLNEVQIWEINNPSGGWFHPVHIHLIDFKILDRNGQPPHPYERGPKDVVYAGENEKIRVIARFGPQKGRYMVHCHNLTHEDHDMMVQFNVGKAYARREDDPNDPILAARARSIKRMRPL
ncbi:MAG: multicopper oxidase domain-containing protein [Nodosilinea sp.]